VASAGSRSYRPSAATAFDLDGLTLDVPELSQPLQKWRVRAGTPRRRKDPNANRPGCALRLNGQGPSEEGKHWVTRSTRREAIMPAPIGIEMAQYSPAPDHLKIPLLGHARYGSACRTRS